MVTVNGLQIDDNITYLLEEIQYKGFPSRKIEIEPISTRPGSKLIAYEWGEKEIYFRGRVFGSTPSDLQEAVDNLQKNFAVPFVSIGIDTGRTYNGTLSELSIPTQFFTLSMAEFEARFICVDPFSYGTYLTASGTVGSGVMTYSGVMTISGTVFAEPTLTIRPAGISGDSGIRLLQIYNSPTGELITISGSINKNADITFDFKNFNVSNAGVNSDYQGVFSRFEPGVISYEITVVSGTNPGYDYKWGYAPRYYQ